MKDYLEMNISEIKPEHCQDTEMWKTCPILKAFRCPDKFICSGCEFKKSDKGEKSVKI